MAKEEGLIGKISKAIKQKINRLGNLSGVESGKTGTSLFGGIISEEFNPELNFPESIEVYDKMRKGDATVAGILEAIKQPIIGGKWVIQPASEDKRDVEVANFARYALFKRINFKCFLEEALTFIDFGFKYFEKVLIKDPEDPKYPDFIFWDKIASRLQNAHYKWDIDGEEWFDSHPPGITQQLPGGTDELGEERVTQPTIPWDKLILFTRKREGNNFEGISALRPGYKHWFFLDLLYKVSGVSAERYGVGVPWAKLKANAGKATEDKVEGFLKNLVSNEQSYARMNTDVEEWGIMTPNGDAKAGAIQYLIDHHTKKIYDSLLGGFLNLTTGDGGSNALSRDQSSFFLKNLQSVADYLKEVIQDHLNELIQINFQNVEDFPKLEVSNIGSISMDEVVNSIKAAKDSELIKVSSNDEAVIREVLGLPPLPEKDEDDLELDKLETELDLMQMEMITLPDDEPQGVKEVNDVEEADQEEPEEMEGDAKKQDPKKLEVTKKELTEFFGSELGHSAWLFVAKGDELSQENKDKITEALRKKSNDTIENDIAKDTQHQILRGSKADILSKLEEVRSMIKSFRDKSQSLDTNAKKAFNKQMKSTIAELKKQRDQLIQDRININTRLEERKKEISASKKERQLQEKIKKTIEREGEKRGKEKEKEQKKLDRYNQKKDAINQKIKNLEGNKNATNDPDKKLTIQDQIDKQQDKLDKLKLNEAQPQVKEREQVFLRNIDEYESFLDEQFALFEKVLVKYEAMYQKGLVAIYEASETEMIDGVSSLKYDDKMIKKAEDFVDKLTEKFKKEIIDSPIQENLFEQTEKFAKKTVHQNNLNLSEEGWEDDEYDYEDVFIDLALFRSFKRGYIYNILGVLFNEPRRMKESIVLNYGSQVAIKLAVKQANGTSFNRNIYKLSTITHARAAFQGIVFNNAQKDGFTHYKVVVPPSKLQELSRQGRTAGLLYFIGTSAVINNIMSKETDGKNTDAVKGLGIGHGTFEYYYPIDGGDLEEEMEIASRQQEEFFEQNW